MTLDLIKIRRDLHQIPEIGLEEFETQAYLLERIAEITAGKDFVEQRTWFISMGLHLKKRSDGGRISMAYRLWNKRALILPPSTKDGCMLVVMICT